MDYTSSISKIYHKVINSKDTGKIATYIPELAKVDPAKFGVHLSTLDKQHFGMGDSEEGFSIQSIAKLLALTMAYNIVGEKLWRRVGVEPSGKPFNSLIQLEYDKGIPRNPLINAGAIVICDVLLSNLNSPLDELMAFTRARSGNEKVSYSERVANSEKLVGNKNLALINLMKSFGNIVNPIDEVMDFYYKLCSIEMNCKELSRTFLYLANYGIDPYSGKKILSKSKSKRMNAVMQLCGLYDEAGEFSFRVGLPGKSGVGGGIVAIYPNNYCIAVWSPRLNKKGNSLKGVRFLEKFTTETRASIF